MHNYQCEECGKTAEIEEYEATFGNHEHYEFNQCKECFEDLLTDNRK